MKIRNLRFAITTIIAVSISISCQKDKSLDPNLLDGYWMSSVHLYDESIAASVGSLYIDSIRELCTFYNINNNFHQIMGMKFRVSGYNLVLCPGERDQQSFEILLNDNVMVLKAESGWHRQETHYIHVARNLVGTWNVIWEGNDGEADVTQRFIFNADGSGKYDNSTPFSWRMGDNPNFFFPLEIDIPSVGERKTIEIARVSLTTMKGGDELGHNVAFVREE